METNTKGATDLLHTKVERRDARQNAKELFAAPSPKRQSVRPGSRRNVTLASKTFSWSSQFTIWEIESDVHFSGQLSNGASFNT